MERAAFSVSDYYLYDTKNIRISTLDNGLDYEKLSDYNNFIKEIATYQNDGYYALQPTSQEYKDIVEDRTFLADSLLNNMVYNQNANPELTNLANFMDSNLDTSKFQWNINDTKFLITLAVISSYAGLMTGLLYLDNKENLYDDYYC